MNKNIGVVIQGPWMAGVTEKVIEFFGKECEIVVYSGWELDKSLIVGQIDCWTLFNELPANPGLQNRNLQRISTYNGLKKIRDLGCTHGLKWRSDILPRRIDFCSLLREVEIDPSPPFMSRLVMSSFRAIAINADWLSTLPDLYMFGRINHMMCMWSYDNLSMDSPCNMPELLKIEMPPSSEGFKVFLEYMYNPHAELYAIYKARLLARLDVFNLSAKKIFSDQFFLDNYLRYKFDWFGGDGLLRSVQKSDFPPLLKPYKIKNAQLKIPSIPVYDLRIWYKTTAIERIKIYLMYKKNIALCKIRSAIWDLNLNWSAR